MGFNKRYLNEKIIKTVLGDGGVDGLIRFIKKPDALIIEDEFSEKVVEIIKNTEEDLIFDKLVELNII
jgi:hypothetical protein